MSDLTEPAKQNPAQVPTAALSIVVPAHNAASFIFATIQSCLNVRGLFCETIVVDDGSADNTEHLCRSFRNEIVFKRVENGGVSRARNIGASMAKGEWLLFLDADDILEPEGPASLIAAAQAAKAGAAYGLVNERQKPPLDARITGQAHAAGPAPLPAIRNYWRCVVVTPGSAVVKRELHERIGGFVSGYEPMEDRDYWIKCGLLESFAHADRIVLDKTWRPVSAGKMDARRIWNGLRSRLALPQWCKENAVKWPEQLPRDEQTLLVKAVNEAVWCRCWNLVGALLRECRSRKISTFWTLRAAVEFRLRGGERRYPEPAWLLPLGC